MIAPDSPIVTAALTAWVFNLASTYEESEANDRLAMAAALNAALAEHMRQQGPALAAAARVFGILPGSAEDRP